MKIYYRKRFLKDLSKIPSKTRMKIEKFVFDEILEANSIAELRKVEQLKGYASYHKIRFGSYRIGLKLENDTVILERALHRKDIYRFFP
jgi:mRNA interferase RelE/StbE